MTKIVAVHSFRGGTGKSNVTANTAARLAADGLRVGLVDTDIQSPGVHAIFGFDREHAPEHTLNDFLAGRSDVAQIATEVSHLLPAGAQGRLFLVASSIQSQDMAAVLRDGYEVERLNDALVQLGQRCELDVLLIDTHPGLNEETLLTAAMCDVLVVLLRPDQQDYQGTAVTVDVAARLGVPEQMLVLNKVYEGLDPTVVSERVAASYGLPVVAVLPLSQDVAANASAGLFVLNHPDHSWTAGIAKLANRIGP